MFLVVFFYKFRNLFLIEQKLFGDYRGDRGNRVYCENLPKIPIVPTAHIGA